MSTKYWSVQRKTSWRRILNNNTTYERRIYRKKPNRQIKIRQVLPHLPHNLQRTKRWSVFCLWTRREVENGSVSIQTLLTFSVDANKCKNNMIYIEEQWGLNHKKESTTPRCHSTSDKKWTASTNEKNFAKSSLQSPSHNMAYMTNVTLFLDPILLVQMFFFFYSMKSQGDWAKIWVRQTNVEATNFWWPVLPRNCRRLKEVRSVNLRHCPDILLN